MKNLHLIPTDKPSRLWINNLLKGKLELSKEMLIGSNTAQNIYITNDEKIILTTDQDLITDGVQAIDDDFLEWFIKNPSCEWVETKVEFIQTPDNLKDGFYYKIIIYKKNIFFKNYKLYF